MSNTQKTTVKYLICDFDGTFSETDFFKSALIDLSIYYPSRIYRSILKSQFNWVRFKECILSSYPLEYYKLTVNPIINNFITENRCQYDKVILVSASPQIFLDKLDILKLHFDHVYGSTDINLKGKNKLTFLRDNNFVPFDYIGDSSSDKIIFENAKQGYLYKRGKLIKLCTKNT
jgi:2-hydroxy-3-keto-5-methylthiopentenyl-1-phosphate phosphatase